MDSLDGVLVQGVNSFPHTQRKVMWLNRISVESTEPALLLIQRNLYHGAPWGKVLLLRQKLRPPQIMILNMQIYHVTNNLYSSVN